MSNTKFSTLFLDKHKRYDYVHLGFICSDGHTSKTSAGEREEASLSNSVVDVWKKKKKLFFIAPVLFFTFNKCKLNVMYISCARWIVYLYLMSYRMISSSLEDFSVSALFSKTIAPMCTQNLCLDNKDPKWSITWDLNSVVCYFYDLMFNCYGLYPMYTLI